MPTGLSDADIAAIPDEERQLMRKEANRLMKKTIPDDSLPY
ncbi:Mobile element protein [Dickeya aquatica]|uniref:Mobile element protein n=1 Tax=Dickeya aquatica TaxID=1401087 RepID=A0A375A9X8_9GAMM|nr:Mobile element protein [Dickeya aquatica]